MGIGIDVGVGVGISTGVDVGPTGVAFGDTGVTAGGNTAPEVDVDVRPGIVGVWPDSVGEIVITTLPLLIVICPGIVFEPPCGPLEPIIPIPLKSNVPLPPRTNSASSTNSRLFCPKKRLLGRLVAWFVGGVDGMGDKGGAIFIGIEGQVTGFSGTGDVAGTSGSSAGMAADELPELPSPGKAVADTIRDTGTSTDGT